MVGLGFLLMMMILSRLLPLPPPQKRTRVVGLLIRGDGSVPWEMERMRESEGRFLS